MQKHDAKKVESVMPPGAGASTVVLQGMWRALLHRSWRLLAVVPTESSTSAGAVIEALEGLAKGRELGPFHVIDARGARIEDGPEITRQFTDPGNVRGIALIDPPVMSLAGIPLVVAADAILLVEATNAVGSSSLRSTLEITGREKWLGSVTLSGGT